MRLVNTRYVVEGKRFRAELEVDEAGLERAAAWEPDEPGRLSLRGRLNGAELDLDAEAWPFARVPRLTGHVTLKGFPLAPMAPLTQPTLDTLQGQLALDVALEGRYTAESGFSYAQDGSVGLTALRLGGKDLDVADESLRWDGRLELDVPASGVPTLMANGTLEQDATAISAPPGQLSIAHKGLAWSGRLDYAVSEGNAQVKTDGKVSVQGLAVTRGSESVKQGRLAWQGMTQVALPSEGAGVEVTAEGKLDGANLAVTLTDGTDFGQKGLKWTGKLHHSTQDGSPAIRAQGKLEMAGVRMERPDLRLQESRLVWEGALSVKLPEKAGSAVSVDGKLAGGEFQATFPSQGLSTGHRALTWSGRFDYGGAEGAEVPESQLNVRGLEVSAPEQELVLLGLEEVQMEGIRLDMAGAGRVARTRFETITMLAPKPPPGGLQRAGGTAPKPAPPVFRAVQAIAEGVELTPDRDLSMGVIQVKGSELLFRRDADGRWYMLERLSALNGQGEASAKETATAAPAAGDDSSPALRINLVRLKDGQVRIEDEAVSPPFQTTLHITEAHLSDLNSADPSQRSQISLNGRVGKHTRVKFRSEFQPFLDRLSLNGTAEVVGLEMPPLAPYTIQQVGYTFTSGELSADVDLQVNQGALDGEARLVFVQLEVEADPAQQGDASQPPADPQSSEMAKGAPGKLTMPIDTALSLLRDKDNSIRLKVPVSGDVNDPKFSVQDAINKALGKASRKAALTYVKYSIQPYGAILTVAEIAGKAATVIRLDPVEFNAGQSQLTEAATTYLDKVSQILKERPAVKIKLCGKATVADRTALEVDSVAKQMAIRMMKPDEEKKAANAESQREPGHEPTAAKVSDQKLRALAKARAVGIEDYLVEKHDADASRLVICGPKIDPRDDAQPRVDMQI